VLVPRMIKHHTETLSEIASRGDTLSIIDGECSQAGPRDTSVLLGRGEARVMVLVS
jgi:hypothetical protein